MLLEEGFQVTSVDASDKMLKYALKERWERRKEEPFDRWGAGPAGAGRSMRTPAPHPGAGDLCPEPLPQLSQPLVVGSGPLRGCCWAMWPCCRDLLALAARLGKPRPWPWPACWSQAGASTRRGQGRAGVGVLHAGEAAG